jgi:hypothetical protein
VRRDKECERRGVKDSKFNISFDIRERGKKQTRRSVFLSLIIYLDKK